MLRVRSETKDSSFYIGGPLEFFLSTLTAGFCRDHVVFLFGPLHQPQCFIHLYFIYFILQTDVWLIVLAVVMTYKIEVSM
jgi:hypothetical protein